MKFQSLEEILFAGKLHKVESRCTKIAATLQRIFSVTSATRAPNKNSLFRNSSRLYSMSKRLRDKFHETLHRVTSLITQLT